MATSLPPVRAAAYTTYVSLVSQADTDIFQKSVTLAAGDVKVSKDGGAEANIGTLPVEIGTSGVLSVALTATEMTADTVTVRFCDAAGDEWCDALIVIHTAARTLDAVIAAVWAYTTRTLTQSAVSVAAAVAGSVVTIKRGDSLSASITGLGDISTRTKLWFTVKADVSDTDAESTIQIEETAGLVYLNGAAGTAGLGDITVDDASAGDITITLDETATDDLTPASGLYYDVQWYDGTSIGTLSEGPCNITADITRSVS